jgi:hypothetical protein
MYFGNNAVISVPLKLRFILSDQAVACLFRAPTLRETGH